MKKDVIVAISVDNFEYLYDVPNFQHIWQYSPPLESHPMEVGKIETKEANIKFMALSMNMRSEQLKEII